MKQRKRKAPSIGIMLLFYCFIFCVNMQNLNLNVKKKIIYQITFEKFSRVLKFIH